MWELMQTGTTGSNKKEEDFIGRISGSIKGQCALELGKEATVGRKLIKALQAFYVDGKAVNGIITPRK